MLDVNLTGSLYFSEIAIPYLRHNKQAGADKSIILISSIAGFLEAPGLPTYAASKHGVLGLMRSLRHHIYPATGIRVNAFCPNAIATAMTAGFSDAYRKAGISVCEVPDTAGIIMQVACEGSINGKAFYLEGGRAWDIDEPLGRLMPQWLGERQCDEIRRGGEILMSVSRVSCNPMSFIDNFIGPVGLEQGSRGASCAIALIKQIDACPCRTAYTGLTCCILYIAYITLLGFVPNTLVRHYTEVITAAHSRNKSICSSSTSCLWSILKHLLGREIDLSALNIRHHDFRQTLIATIGSRAHDRSCNLFLD